MRAEVRHQLKQDRFSRTTLKVAGRTVHWSSTHKLKIGIAAAVLVLLAGGGLGGWYYLNHRDQEASLALNQAVRMLDTPIRPQGMPAQPDNPSYATVQERADAAQKRLSSIVKSYPHTRGSQFAHYLLGITAKQEGDYTTAASELSGVADSGSKEVAALARFALASVYCQQNRTKEAIQIYKQMVDKPQAPVSKTMVQLALADSYQADNQPLEAKRIYQDLQKENPGSRASQMAEQRLAELK